MVIFFSFHHSLCIVFALNYFAKKNVYSSMRAISLPRNIANSEEAAL